MESAGNRPLRLGWVIGAIAVPLVVIGGWAGPARCASPSAASQPASAPDLTGPLTRLRAKWLGDLGDDYSAASRSPFLVVIQGDDAAARRWLTGTVVGAAERMNKQFFAKRPDKPIVVLLFAGQESYRKACKDLLAVPDPPHYGFCRPGEQGMLLVMDINTGGGTLVHELFHALAAFDFPAIPDWFNEGAASLYECCLYEENRLVGMVNWRLPALQKAIRADTLGSLEALTTCDFRGAKVGLNYAQARYLCQYLQDKGLLERYYKTFRDNQADDLTGLKFLNQIVAPASLAEFEKAWRPWVLSLKQP